MNCGHFPGVTSTCGSEGPLGGGQNIPGQAQEEEGGRAFVDSQAGPERMTPKSGQRRHRLVQSGDLPLRKERPPHPPAHRTNTRPPRSQARELKERIFPLSPSAFVLPGSRGADLGERSHASTLISAFGDGCWRAADMCSGGR